MTAQPPPASVPPEPAHPEPMQPEPSLAAISGVALRLMAGAVSRRSLDDLKRTVRGTSEYPWREVHEAVLAATPDGPALAKRGLAAQRDWILRSGQQTTPRPLSTGAKTLAAKLLAQLIFFAAYSLVMTVLLLVAKHKWPEADVYRLLTWAYEAFPNLVPK